jgi:hypothetical protein
MRQVAIFLFMLIGLLTVSVLSAHEGCCCCRRPHSHHQSRVQEIPPSEVSYEENRPPLLPRVYPYRSIYEDSEIFQEEEEVVDWPSRRDNKFSDVLSR